MRSPLLTQAQAAVLVTTALLGSTVSAVENGVGIYLLGSRGPLAGYLPEAGTYLQNDLYFYEGSVGGNRSFPTGGEIVASVDSGAVIDLISASHVLDGEILGGSFAFGAIVPVGHADVEAGVTLDPVNFAPRNRTRSDSATALGDPLLSASLGWHEGNFHWNGTALVNVPVGDYRNGELANIAFNHWALDLSGALTWFSLDTGTELSAVVGMTWNDTNDATDYRSGNELHLEWSATQALSRELSLGLVGYHYKQVSDDSGSGARLGGYRGRSNAAGITIAYNFTLQEHTISTRLKAYREYDTVNRMDGSALFLTVTLPLQN